MMLSKWLLFLFAIPTITGFQQLWNSDEFSVGRMQMKMILELCYENDSLSDPTIIFGGFNDYIDKSSIVRMDSSLKVHDEKEERKASNVRASRIVIIEELLIKLESDLMLLKNSGWWDPLIPVFIIVKNLIKCEHFKEILIKTWEMDMINSIYICSESENASALYTMNAMANFAPYPWKRVEELDLNVFRQIFDPDTSCQTLKYDKTKFLEDYEIKAVRLLDRVSSREDSAHDSNAISVNIFRSICTSLNASFIIESEANTDLILDRLSSGTSDLMLHRYPLEWHSETAFVTPYYLTQYIAVMKLSPEQSTLQKILHLWSTPVLIFAGIALVILFAVLIVKNDNISSAMLDMIRLLTYVSIQTDNRRHSFRIYFTTMLIFMIISNGVFQGKISSFLTKQERFKAVETINELIELGYKFHAYPGMDEFIKSKCPKCNVVNDENPSDACIDYLQNTTLRVCILTKAFYEEKFALFPVEYIKEPLSETYFYYKCRDNWAIHERINRMLLRINSAGLLTFWRKEKTDYLMEKHDADEIEKTLPHYQPVKLAKLDFAFHLLAIGLSLAIGVFFLESVVAEYKIN